MAPNQPYASNELTHLVGSHFLDSCEQQFELLCKILSDGVLLPSGDPERAPGNLDWSAYEKFSSNRYLVPDMVCFCDIPFDCLGIHMAKYGQFGITFKKRWLAANGANPVFYLSKKSACTDHNPGNDKRGTNREAFFDRAIADWIGGLKRAGYKAHTAERSTNLFLWYFLAYSKFFDDSLPEDHKDNYYMEREWRTIGQLTFAPENVCHVILPDDFAPAFTSQFPMYKNRLHTF